MKSEQYTIELHALISGEKNGITDSKLATIVMAYCTANGAHDVTVNLPVAQEPKVLLPGPCTSPLAGLADVQ